MKIKSAICNAFQHIQAVSTRVGYIGISRWVLGKQMEDRGWEPECG